MSVNKLSFYIFVIILVLSCNKDKSVEENSIFMAKESDLSGITFSNKLVDRNDLNIIEYLYYYNGAGVATGDINNDGLDDIYFSGNQTPDQLYLNKGNLKFENITEKAGIKDYKTWSTGVAMDDVNNDGLIDIYVCKVAMNDNNPDDHNLLYINQGGNTFKEMSNAYGLDFKGFSTHAGFFDYDRDGDLDMYLLNQNIHNVNSYGTIDKRNLKDTLAGDVFYENKIKENGKFEDVTARAGIYSSPLGYGLGLSLGDVNNDGWTDIYVGNDFHENDYLYLNNGDKTFKESISSAVTHTTQFSMGVDMADMNNDGWLDIFTTDMMPFDPAVVLVSAGEDSDQIKQIKKEFGFLPQTARNHFQINQKTGTFTDIALFTRTFATDWSWSVLLQDFDNDTQNDIFITNGIVKRPNNLDYINFLNELDNKNPKANPDRTKKLIENMPSEPLKNVFFRNTGDLQYTDISKSLIGKPSFSTGAAYSDFDNDGDLDIITNNINEEAFLYENTAKKQSSVSVMLQGNKEFASVKGSKVSLYYAKGLLSKEVQTTRGFMSSSSHRVNFGLGANNVIDSMVIRWPDGMTQTINKPEINKNLVVNRPPLNELKLYTFVQNQPTKSFEVLPIRHEENQYNDENNEKLIPERLSNLGPALISADLNNDKIMDMFVGGAKNQPARIFLGKSDGSFTLKKTPDFIADAKYEDVDAALIDFDGDGDKDIYVVSGGNEAKELDKTLEDRIYMNNGNGDFRRIPISLPHTNGSCIAIADYDGDGFEDIFVGSRSIPGNYGLSPYSFILRNRNGMGVEIGYKERYGMITDAHWVDINGDKKVDLVMCGDWMSILILENDGKGTLTNKSKEYGVDGIYGMWNSLAFSDLNKDGILDIIAGNTGLNHKWTASDSLPVKMYVGDFDGNGSTEPLIFYHYFSRYIPFAPLGTMTSQIPLLKKKFKTFSSYKNTQDITDLFDNSKDKIVETKNVNELRSMYFLSKNKKFSPIPLNREEQLSDIMDIEIDQAGRIYYVGNNWNYVSELGPSTSNAGRMLGEFNISSGTFAKSLSLSLPNQLNGRKIKLLDKDRMLVADNNGYIYVVK